MEQENSGLVSDNYNELPREANKTKDSTADRIFKYYHHKNTRIELSDEEHVIRNRWEKAWFLLCHHNIRKDVVAKLEKLFGIKKSVAYDDVRNAMMLFGDPQTETKDAKRAIAETMAMRAARKCWKKGDMAGYDKFLQKYIDLNGLNEKDDGKLKDVLKNLKATTLVFVTSPEQLKKQADDLIKDIPTVETSYEEVKDDED